MSNSWPLSLSWIVLLPLGLTAGLEPSVQAGEPTPLRKLCIESSVVVLARPLDAETPTRFRVLQVLRTTSPRPLRAGDTVTPVGLDAARVRTLDETDQQGKKGKGKPRLVSLALLFLEPCGDGKAWRVRPTGFRFCTADGRLLAPADSEHRPVASPLRWAVVVRQVKEDLATLDRLDSLCRNARPARKVAGLLDWVKRHRSEFAAVSSGTDEAPTGWDRLQLDVFDWIFACADPAEAWQAVRLYAELNGCEAPRLITPTFASPQGRSLLVDIVRDGRALTGDRIRAANLLAQRVTLWPAAREQRPGAVVVTAAEQQKLLDALAAVLTEKDEMLRVELTRALECLSCPEQEQRRTARALPSLIKAYREARPGSDRDQLALTVCRLASPAQWKALTGNPAGVCVVLGDVECKGTQVTLWLGLKSASGPVYEAPTLVVERLGNFGFVAQTLRVPLRVNNLPGKWSDGWTGEDTLVAQFDPGAFLQPGSAFRVKVEGFVGKGKDRQAWRSEPRKFNIPAVRPGTALSDSTWVDR